MFRKLLTVAALGAFVLAAMPAQAANVCGDRASVLSRLAQGYGEARVAIGLASDGTLVEVLTSPTGSWTIIVTKPGGTTCVAAAGENWQPIQTTANAQQS